MRGILDRLHLEYPLAGSPMLRGMRILQGCRIGRRLEDDEAAEGIRGALPVRATTKHEPGHKTITYLPERHRDHAPTGMGMDITYIRWRTAASRRRVD